MINITITADTAEELRNQLITLIGNNVDAPAFNAANWVKENVPAGLPGDPLPTAEKPATRTRTKVVAPEPTQVIALPEQEPSAATAAGPPPAKEPVSNDLLDTPAPVAIVTPAPTANGQTSLLDTPVATAEETKKPGEIITLNDVRNKIAKAVIAGTITKPKVTEFLANYETSKGQPCTIPSDIQEKDMALVFNAIDFI